MSRLFLLLLGCLAAAGRSADPAPAPLGRDQFLALLVREVASHFRLEGDLQLEPVRAWVPPARTARAWAVDVIEYPNQPSASMLLRCRIVADGEPLADSAMVLRASLARDAWFARTPLASGGVLDPSKLEARRIDVFRERDVVPAAVGERAYIMTRSVPAGRVLTWHDIARRPLVKKGDLIEVAASEGHLLVTLKALALENGAQGDTVMVRNPATLKTFAALVVDENRVQVRF